MTTEKVFTKEEVKTTLNAVVKTVEKFLDADASKLTTEEREEVKIFGAMDSLIEEVTEKMEDSNIKEDSTEYTECLRDRAIKTAESLEILRPKILKFADTLNKFYRAGFLNQERQKRKQRKQST